MIWNCYRNSYFLPQSAAQVHSPYECFLYDELLKVLFGSGPLGMANSASKSAGFKVLGISVEAEEQEESISHL